MKFKTVLLKQDCFIYRDNEYSFFKIDEIKNEFLNNLKVIILEQVVYVKTFIIKNKLFNKEKFVEDKIREFFPQNGDILYDYKKDNRNSLISIYSIKSRYNIESICENAKNIRIIPIQYIVIDVIKSLTKKSRITSLVIVEINNIYYSIIIKNGFLHENHLCSDIRTSLELLNYADFIKNVYIDTNINEKIDELFLSKFEIIRKDIKEKVYERIYKK